MSRHQLFVLAVTSIGFVALFCLLVLLPDGAAK